MRNIFAFLIVIFSLISCSEKKDSKTLVNTDTSVKNEDSLIKSYHEILEGLKLNYVLFYRSLKSDENFDFKTYGLNDNDSIYEMDSIRYYKSYDLFFKQQNHFIKWLLKFKRDSRNSGLFHKSHYPLSSYISDCTFRLSNSRAAIILLENFLEGEGFECFECKKKEVNRIICEQEKYKQIENFLKLNKGNTIKQLREKWKKQK